MLNSFLLWERIMHECRRLSSPVLTWWRTASSAVLASRLGLLNESAVAGPLLAAVNFKWQG